MDERTGEEYIGKPPPNPYPEEAARRHKKFRGADLGSLGTRPLSEPVPFEVTEETEDER